MQKILLVEDNRQVQAIIDRLLEGTYDVHVAATVKQACRCIEKYTYNLILLDIQLPDGDGFTFLDFLRKRFTNLQIPVLMLTGRTELESKLKGFSLGADDYIVKPFDPDELKARINTRIKQSIQVETQEEVLDLGTLSVHLSNQRVYLQTESKPKEIVMTPLEFRIFSYLARHKDSDVTRQQMMDAIWGNTSKVTDRTIDTHMSNIRKKISAGDYEIRSVHSLGYRLQHKSEKKEAA